jgi:hypothetical protein
MNTHWQLSPRIGFNYKMQDARLAFHGGAGLFTGHMLNVWADELYNVNIYMIDIVPQLYNIRFIPDPYHQPGISLLGANPAAGRGYISIVSKHYKYPVGFKTSLSADKQLNKGWKVTAEVLFTKNIHEHTYTNVNLLPPARQSALPDKRNVFSLNSQSERIPMNGGNPYTSIILLSNNKGASGYSYSLTAVVSKTVGDKLTIHAAYTYGHSMALFEPNRDANSSLSQWSAISTVNGKNYARRGVSDFDLGHRMYINLSKQFSYAKNKTSTLIAVFYNGQSGQPFSYVYSGSIINDNGRVGIPNADLIYIPTAAELNEMIFLPNTVLSVTYSPAEQKEMLNEYIENDRYLGKHRGRFAERNGARLPFTHTIDLRIQQDIKIDTKRKEWQVSIIYDVFNIANMLNKNWGRMYFLGGNSYPVIRFAGFANSATLAEQYQFMPVQGKPWGIQASTAPGSSARWISQLGIRINFN